MPARRVVLSTIEFGDSNGPPIVALHGGHGSAGDWTRLGAEALPLRRWICPNFRGFGSTPASPDVPLWSVAQYARDALATVDSIGLGRFDVIGFSAGARIAIELTRRGASRVRSAVLLDPPLMSRDEYREWADRQAPRFPTEIAGVSARVDEASTFETLDEIVALLSPELPATARPQAEREVLANLVERTQTGGFQVRADAPNYWSVTTGQIAESLPASFDAFAGRVLLLIAERVDSVTESGHRALRSELGARLTSVGIDATHRLLWDSFDTTVSEIAQFLDDEDRKQPLV